MENIELQSTQFSKLNATTKDLINMGKWFLYAISYPPISDAQFYLATDGMSYFLSADGGVLAKTPKTPEDLVLNKQVLFSDLPSPQSLRNFSVAWA